VLEHLESHVCETLAGARDCDQVKRRRPDVYASQVVPLWRAAMPAAALLHLETSAALAALDGADAADAADLHQRIAAVLIDRLAMVEAGSPREEQAWLRPVRRRAQLLLVWRLQQGLELEALDAQLRQALRSFPGDGDLLLASGWIEETKALPAQIRNRYDTRPAREAIVGGRAGWIARERAFRLARAEALYRSSLAASPPPADAPLRLGRVLYLQGRLDEAHAALGQAASALDLPRVRYLSALFQAAVDEQARRPAQARRQYAAALSIWPASQAARVGLARLMVRDGERAAASALIQELPAAPPRIDLEADPWWWYAVGQAWRFAPGIESLRRELRR
jgi:tetratricopeptide (TPR) repeat protein